MWTRIRGLWRKPAAMYEWGMSNWRNVELVCWTSSRRSTMKMTACPRSEAVRAMCEAVGVFPAPVGICTTTAWCSRSSRRVLATTSSWWG